MHFVQKVFARQILPTEKLVLLRPLGNGILHQKQDLKKSLNENVFLAAILKKYTIPDFSKNLNLRVYFRVLSTFPSFAQNKPEILDPRITFFFDFA